MNDIKCTHHPQEDIILICKSCSNYKPACRKCITSVHQDHSFLDIDDLDDGIKDDIIIHYYNNTLPQLDTILDNCKSKLVESDNHFKKIEQDHKNNFNRLESTFKSIRDIINAKEIILKNQIDTDLDYNKKINITNSTLYNNIITTINNIKNENNNNNNINNINIKINQNQFIELIKRNDQCNTFDSIISTKPTPTINNSNNSNSISNNSNSSNNNNNSNNNILQQYEDTIMIFSEDSIDSFKDKAYMMIQIPDKQSQSLKVENRNYKSYSFKVYQDGHDISTINYSSLAIDNGHHLRSVFPTCVTSLLLPDDFDQPLNSLPSHIHTLFLFNIKLQLKEGSIPNSITTIHFCDGFSQRLGNRIIHKNVNRIYLGNTVHPLEDKIFRECGNKVHVTKSYQHKTPTIYNNKIKHLNNQSLSTNKQLTKMNNLSTKNSNILNQQ